MVNIFITGASGYIGSVVSELALKKGHSLRGLARNDAAAEKLRALGVEPVRGDLYTLDVLAEEAKKADAGKLLDNLTFVTCFRSFILFLVWSVLNGLCASIYEVKVEKLTSP